jgi:hypothetical protein
VLEGVGRGCDHFSLFERKSHNLFKHRHRCAGMPPFQCLSMSLTAYKLASYSVNSSASNFAASSSRLGCVPY